VKAPAAGVVSEFICAEGDQVAEGVLLLHFDRSDAVDEVASDAAGRSGDGDR
jgi:hypothetical protein